MHGNDRSSLGRSDKPNQPSGSDNSTQRSPRLTSHEKRTDYYMRNYRTVAPEPTTHPSPSQREYDNFGDQSTSVQGYGGSFDSRPLQGYEPSFSHQPYGQAPFARSDLAGLSHQPYGQTQPSPYDTSAPNPYAPFGQPHRSPYDTGASNPYARSEQNQLSLYDTGASNPYAPSGQPQPSPYDTGASNPFQSTRDVPPLQRERADLQSHDSSSTASWVKDFREMDLRQIRTEWHQNPRDMNVKLEQGRLNDKDRRRFDKWLYECYNDIRSRIDFFSTNPDQKKLQSIMNQFEEMVKITQTDCEKRIEQLREENTQYQALVGQLGEVQTNTTVREKESERSPLAAHVHFAELSRLKDRETQLLQALQAYPRPEQSQATQQQYSRDSATWTARLSECSTRLKDLLPDTQHEIVSGNQSELPSLGLPATRGQTHAFVDETDKIKKGYSGNPLPADRLGASTSTWPLKFVSDYHEIYTNSDPESRKRQKRERKKEINERAGKIARGGRTDKYGNKYSDMTEKQREEFNREECERMRGERADEHGNKYSDMTEEQKKEFNKKENIRLEEDKAKKRRKKIERENN